MPCPRDDLNADQIVQLYQAGESIGMLSIRFRASHDAIRRHLRRARVDLRNRSAAGRNRVARDGTSPNVGRVARERAGQLVTDQAMRNRAVNNQASQRLVGRFEAEVQQWLSFGGFKTYRQVAVDRYNVDLLVSPNVAVEIHTSRHAPRQGSHFPGFAGRIEALADKGISALYVWCPDGINPGDGYQLIANVEVAGRYPSPHGQYRVFRCHGYPPATGRPERKRLPLVPSASYPPDTSRDDRGIR